MKRSPARSDSLRYLVAAIFLGALLLNLLKWSHHTPPERCRVVEERLDERVSYPVVLCEGPSCTHLYHR